VYVPNFTQAKIKSLTLYFSALTIVIVTSWNIPAKVAFRYSHAKISWKQRWLTCLHHIQVPHVLCWFSSNILRMITTDRPSTAVSRMTLFCGIFNACPIQESKIPTASLWCKPLHSLHKICEKHCESHLGFSHITIQILCTNSGHYVACAWKIFIFHFTVLFCGKRIIDGSKWEHIILRQWLAYSWNTVPN
jgi:hypothetical protein